MKNFNHVAKNVRLDSLAPASWIQVALLGPRAISELELVFLSLLGWLDGFPGGQGHPQWLYPVLQLPGTVGVSMQTIFNKNGKSNLMIHYIGLSS